MEGVSVEAPNHAYTLVDTMKRRRWGRMAENSLPGTGMNPELVANSILVRAFRD